MAGTITLAAFTQRVLRRLNEANNSAVGDLPTGVGGAPTTATSVTIGDFATEGVQLLTRTCYPLIGGFTASLTSVSGGRRTNYGEFTPIATEVASGSVLWAALKDGVSFTPTAGTLTPLVFCSESALGLHYRNYLSDAAGSPKYWYMSGPAGIMVYPAASVNGTVTVRGLYVSVSASSSGAMFTQIPDDLLTSVIETFVCGRLAQKNMDDPLLSARAEMWLTEFELQRRMLYDRLDSGMKAYFPAFVPITVGAGK